MKAIVSKFLQCTLVSVWIAGAGCALAGEKAPRHLNVLLVVGASGNESYGGKFAKEAEAWQAACARASIKVNTIGAQPELQDKDDAQLLREHLEQSVASEDALWLVLIGHGSFDGREAKFNLRGPDITASELAGWLKPVKHDLAVINTASSSAPFVRALSGANRVIISATKSADEVFYTRFGEFFAQAISGLPGADLDRDDQVSLLEAFLWSSRQVDRFFETEGRLATEHALIDDNGDGLGTRADWFEGLRCVKLAGNGATPDGGAAKQWCLVLNDDEAALSDEIRKKRDALEHQVESLRARKDKIETGDYYKQLENLFADIARLTEPKDKPGSSQQP